MSELIKLEPKKLQDLFLVENGLKPVLDGIKTITDCFVGDMSTEAGRKDIASMSYSVARSKTHILAMKKEATADLRAKTSNINSEGKKAEIFLDNLRDEIRKELTEFESEEKRASQERENKINRILELKLIDSSASLDEMASNLKEAQDFEVDEILFPKEMEFKAFKQKDQTIKELNLKIDAKIKYNAEQTELRILREKQDKQDAEDKKRDDLLKEGERKDLAEKAEIKRLEQEKENANNQQRMAEERERQAKINEESAKKDLASMKEAQEKSRLIKEKMHEDNLKNETENKRVIHNRMLDALMANGLDEVVSKKVITLIALKKIPNISVDYFISNSTSVEEIASNSQHSIKKGCVNIAQESRFNLNDV